MTMRELLSRPTRINTFTEIIMPIAHYQVAHATLKSYNLVVDTIKTRDPIDKNFVLELHHTLLSYHPSLGGLFRPAGTTGTIGYIDRQSQQLVQKWIPLEVNGDELLERFDIACRWLNEETDDLKENEDDLERALHLASEIQYMFTYPGLHPFVEGNGRLSRWLSNLATMINAEELKTDNVLMPFPLIRKNKATPYTRPENWKDDYYLIILRQAYQSKKLNILDNYLAAIWRNRLSRTIHDFEQELNLEYNQNIPENDLHLLTILKAREGRLAKVIGSFKYQDHLAPDFF